MHIGLLKPEAEEQYRSFVDNHPNASIYHTLEWRHIIQKTYGYRPCYIIAEDGEEIKGILPLFEVNSFIHGRRLVSIPFSHWVDVLYQDAQDLQQMIDFARHLTQERRCRYLEIKHGSELPENIDLASSGHFIDSILSLSASIDDIWDGFEGSVRRAVRKSKSSSLKLIEGQEVGHYRTFHRLELETRKRQGSPPYSSAFFEALYSILHLSGKAKLYLASIEGQYIAGMIILLHNKVAIYGYGASTSNRDFLKLRPNNLLFWQAIQDLHHHDYEFLDFGTTDPSNKGLLRFKSSWGTKDFHIPYYYFLNTISDTPVFDRNSFKLRIASSLLRRMPIPLLRTVGPVLLRQLG